MQEPSKGSQTLQKRPYPQGRAPEWAQNARQVVMWSRSQAAVLGNSGTLTVVDVASLEPRLQVPDCNANAVLASAGASWRPIPSSCLKTYMCAQARQ